MKYDVVATIGTYEKDGQKKYLTDNVGRIITTKDGHPKLLLKKTFNPAALQASEDGMVWLALFEPRDKSAPASKPSNDDDDGIMF